MERITQVNPQRIQWCCDDRGITIDELCLSCGISPGVMEKMMEEDGGLTFRQLQAVAKHFQRGILFFLEEAPVNPRKVHTPQYRTIVRQKPDVSDRLLGLIQRVETQREVYLTLLEDLGESPPQFVAPTLAGRSTDAAALAVRKWLGLGDRNDFDSYRAAVEAKGILVFRSNGYSGDWQIPKKSPVIGFSLFVEVCPVILVKKQAFASRQSFTLMHELAHLLLHKESFVDVEADLHSEEKREREANAFAGALLVPDNFLNEILLTQKPGHAGGYDEWLKDQRKAWGVSGEVILRRLKDKALLPPADYQAYRNLDRPPPQEKSGSREWRHREPRHIFGDPYVRTVLDALNARKIPLTRASKYLDNLKLQDLHQLGEVYASV